MIEISLLLQKQVADGLKSLYASEVELSDIQFQKTRKDFEGDLTVVVFPFLKISKKGPEQTANDLGNYLLSVNNNMEAFNVVKGFLNITLTHVYWLNQLMGLSGNANYGLKQPGSSGKSVMVEYSSPNTNKPLHLGHIRNNLLGYSVAEILKANGHTVYKVNLVNDRGIHICKSMLAWQKWGNGITPEQAGVKGDKLVGDYYVRFDQEYKKQIKELMAAGQTEELAKENAPLIAEAREMLRQWEAGNPDVVSLWSIMNSWVYSGFDITYKNLGVDFDKIYYESETYKLGKSIVLDGLKSGVLLQKDDSSIWADLTTDGLDQKLLLRSDGTSVYMTQDLGTAVQRFNEFKLDSLIYVVGNEQNYHFQVLSLVLKKLGYLWSDHILHLSYGMVELPQGKMKSREGTVVDADDLMDEMIKTARETSEALGKLDGFLEAELADIYNMVGLGALKYFILKVDPKKTMLFNPTESIDFNGNTGPFIQYSHARIKSVWRKASEAGMIISEININSIIPHPKELSLIKLLTEFPQVVAEAGQGLSPALVANYCYELAKEYNQFYHECPVLKEENSEVRNLRLVLSANVANVIKKGCDAIPLNSVSST
jgi:arginyl-tRNA synthetase